MIKYIFSLISGKLLLAIGLIFNAWATINLLKLYNTLSEDVQRIEHELNQERKYK